jgi:hypothetical protein
LRNIASNSGKQSFQADDASTVGFESFSFVHIQRMDQSPSGRKAPVRRYLIA